MTIDDDKIGACDDYDTFDDENACQTFMNADTPLMMINNNNNNFDDEN